MRSWFLENTKKPKPRGKPRCAATPSWRNSFWCDESGKDLDMGTNGTDIAVEPRLEEFRLQKVDHGQPLGPVDKTPPRKRALEADPVETAEDFALAPLVDKIAHSIARGLVVAMKELEHHIS